VLGTSESGFGVHGLSDGGPGGVFESKTNAQVRLVPREMTSPAGQVPGGGGELLATMAAGVFRLWFCTRAGDAASAAWDLVVGTRPFPGAPLSEATSGIDVKRVQMRLNMVFGTDLNGDGEFGAITRDAVVAFQEREGIAQTGVVDAETWDRLFALT
jgi:peptidoglycan hydrolase-like protein with peptidoglycan-binding domain